MNCPALFKFTLGLIALCASGLVRAGGDELPARGQPVDESAIVLRIGETEFSRAEILEFVRNTSLGIADRESIAQESKDAADYQRRIRARLEGAYEAGLRERAWVQLFQVEAYQLKIDATETDLERLIEKAKSKQLERSPGTGSPEERIGASMIAANGALRLEPEARDPRSAYQLWLKIVRASAIEDLRNEVLRTTITRLIESRGGSLEISFEKIQAWQQELRAQFDRARAKLPPGSIGPAELRTLIEANPDVARVLVPARLKLVTLQIPVRPLSSYSSAQVAEASASIFSAQSETALQQDLAEALRIAKGSQSEGEVQQARNRALRKYSDSLRPEDYVEVARLELALHLKRESDAEGSLGVMRTLIQRWFTSSRTAAISSDSTFEKQAPAVLKSSLGSERLSGAAKRLANLAYWQVTESARRADLALASSLAREFLKDETEDSVSGGKQIRATSTPRAALERFASRHPNASTVSRESEWLDLLAADPKLVKTLLGDNSNYYAATVAPRVAIRYQTGATPPAIEVIAVEQKTEPKFRSLGFHADGRQLEKELGAALREREVKRRFAELREEILAKNLAGMSVSPKADRALRGESELRAFLAK